MLSSFQRMACALSTIDNFANVNVDSVGSMCIQCPKCWHFVLKKKKNTICCYNGKIANEHVNHPIVHPMLNELYIGTTPKSREFLKSIRKYNQAFAFTSMQSIFKSNQVEGRGIYTICVNGELCHHIGNLQPNLDQGARFAQIYS